MSDCGWLPKFSILPATTAHAADLQLRLLC